MRLILILICLMLCAGTVSSRAELQLQSKMDAMCRPASPTNHSILRWKPRDTCTNDCFVSRLTCSNGKTFELQSKFHPATTEFQMVFYNWAPWSVLIYLLPFVAIVGVATIGSRLTAPLLVLNVLLVTYAATAAWSLHASITGNPRGEGAWLEQALFLNPYSFGAFSFLFIVANLLPIWRVLENLSYRHSADAVIVPSFVQEYRTDATFMRAALMPNIYEFVDPRETTTQYQRDTERLRAFKDKLDAETAFAEAYIRRERTRNHLNEHR